MKKSNETIFGAITTALLVCLLGILITFILAYVLDILVLSAAIPQFSEIFPSLESTLKEISLNDKNADRLSKIIFSSCMLISFFPAFILSYRTRRKRKEKFLDETKGFITRKEGLIYHFKNHYLSEALIFICTLLIFLCGGIFSPAYIFRLLFGNLLALPLTIIVILSAQVLSILFAQAHWRAIHFIGEE
jgi:hypothetical protein